MPNPNSLRVIREQRRLELRDVAEFARISPESLATFEEGAKEPSRKQLERLADTYGVPLYTFFSKAIPNIPDTPTDFRKRDPGPSIISPQGMKSLLTSQRISHFSYQLKIELKYEAPDLPSVSRRMTAPENRAALLREAFDDWLASRQEQLQLSGQIEQRFLLAFRLFFEVQGGVLNLNEAPESDYMGFFVEPDNGSPSIFVNRKIMSKKAQLFTLAHEYAHFLLKTEGISNPFSAKNQVERACNIFAAEFLAPGQNFDRIVEGINRSTREDTFSFVSAVSRESLLSKHATAIRLVERGYLSQSKYKAWEAVWRKAPRAEKDEEKEETTSGAMGAPHAKRISEIGYFPVYLAAKAIQEKAIDAVDVENGIGLSSTLQQRAFSLAVRRFEAARN